MQIYQKGICKLYGFSFSKSHFYVVSPDSQAGMQHVIFFLCQLASFQFLSLGVARSRLESWTRKKEICPIYFLFFFLLMLFQLKFFIQQQQWVPAGRLSVFNGTLLSAPSPQGPECQPCRSPSLSSEQHLSFSAGLQRSQSQLLTFLRGLGTSFVQKLFQVLCVFAK